MIRLYGHLAGSFKTVSKGLEEAFTAFNVLDGCYIAEQQDFYAVPVSGANAPVAVVVGSPLRVELPHSLGMHEEVWLLLAPNSEGIPPSLQQQLDREQNGKPVVSGFLAPSHWARSVLERTFPNHPVVLCQHGVSAAFRPIQTKDVSDTSNIAMHFTSSGLSRKGTKQLVDCWAKVCEELSKDVTLYIFANPYFAPEILRYAHKAMAEKEAKIVVSNGQNLTEFQLAKMYQQADLIIQPSRAEGFGLVPLEARACGVPVVCTANTGHVDHVATPTDKGCVIVPSGPLIKSDDYWGAQAPQVLEEDIQKSVVFAFQQLSRLKQEAKEAALLIQERWTWAEGSRSFVEYVKGKYGQSRY